METLSHVPHRRINKDKEGVYRKIPAEIVILKKLKKSYGKKIALYVEDLVFDEGVYIIRGPNGSGKSTLLGIIAGIIKPSQGEVKVLGRDPFKDDGVKKLMGFVGHKTFLLEDLSGYENWNFFGKFNEDLADLMGIKGILNRPIRTYSRGERVKLSVCIEISRYPKVLLLDEPFSSLDECSKKSLVEILNGINGTVIITAHGTIPLKAKSEYYLKNENPIN